MNTLRLNSIPLLKTWLLVLSLLAAPLALADEPRPQQAQVPEIKVNINTADAETLALALDGVGIARAREIVAWREQNGEFKTVEQLQEVRGIGAATIERNRHRIILTDKT